MAHTAHILVGGGTGFVGRHLAHCLRQAGAKVKIITRRIDKGPDYITWNQIRDEGIPKETSAVVNVSGRNILDPTFWTESYKRDVYDSRIETNRLLVDAIQSASSPKLKAFVTISGVGYYKPSDSIEYDESWSQDKNISSPQEMDYLMKLAKEWELASQLPKDSPVRRVIIRSGVVLGPDGGIVKQLKLPFSLALGGPLGDGKQWFPWIHVLDLANMFKFAIFNEQISGVINGVAPEQATNKQFVQAFGRALNRPAIIPVPSFVINKMFGPDRADILLKGPRVKSRSTSLGYTYEFPSLDEACKNCVLPHHPPKEPTHPPKKPPHGPK